MKTNPKVFIGLEEVAGYFGSLKTGFLENGIYCKFITLSEHPFQYGKEDKNIFSSFIKKLNKISLPSNRYSKIIKNVLFSLSKFMLFLWVLFKFDVIIYSFNSSFFSYKELPILKFFNKKIIYVYLGSDSRPPYFNGKVIVPYLIKKILNGSMPPYFNGKEINLNEINQIYNMSKKVNETIKKIEKYADYIIDYPTQAHFHERDFIMGLILGFPKDFKNKEEIIEEEKTKIRILHSPSSPIIKGTFEIEESISNLKKKGYEIDYIKILNKSNAEVIEEIKQCDFIVDQKYSDTPLAGFATEGAFFGKPSIVGSYYCSEIHKDLEQKDIPPSIFCLPEELEENIEKLIKDSNYRYQKGKEIREFVAENWNSKKVASKYLRIIKGEIPKEWFYSPYNITYIHGVGISEDNLKKFLKEYIYVFGLKALFLDDKPSLAKKIKDFVE